MIKGKNIAMTLAAAVAVTTGAGIVNDPTEVKASENKDIENKTKEIQQKNIVFTDVNKSDWSYDSIYWGVENDIVKGYEDGTFKPKEQITEQEFASVLARYVTNIDNNKLKAKDGEPWSQPAYDELAKFQLPFKGYNDPKVKATALTRGDIARIIAAKNGFNLNERQAIYYMYENQISYGLIEGTVSYESYGKDEAVSREQIPAFMKRLGSLGQTTFKGTKSKVKGNEMGGIVGVEPSKSVIRDEEFKELEGPDIDFEKLRKGEWAPAEPVTELQKKVAPLAEKYGYFINPISVKGKNDFAINEGDKSLMSFRDQAKKSFAISMDDYHKNKGIFVDILKATGKMTEFEINETVRLIEDVNSVASGAKYYEIVPNVSGVRIAGGFRKISLYFSLDAK